MRYADELEWRFASRWSGIAWEDFQAMEGDEQSAVVAAYRCQMQIDAILAQEQMRKMNRTRPPRKRR